jgi:hypothetical protein
MKKNKGIRKYAHIISSILYDVWFFFFCSILGYVLFPIISMIFPLWAYIEIRDKKYLRHYPTYAKRGLANSWELVKKNTGFRLIKNRFILPKGYVEKQLKKRKGKCLRCGKCCKGLKCPVVKWDTKKKQWVCEVYGKWFWNHVNCSTYPYNQKEVDLYDCKGFWFEK